MYFYIDGLSDRALLTYKDGSDPSFFSEKKGEKEAYMIERTSSVSARHVFFFSVSFPPHLVVLLGQRGVYRSLTGPICPNVPKRPFSCLALKEQQRQFRHFPSYDDIVAGRYKTFKNVDGSLSSCPATTDDDWK